MNLIHPKTELRKTTSWLYNHDNITTACTICLQNLLAVYKPSGMGSTKGQESSGKLSSISSIQVQVENINTNSQT